MTLFSYVTRVVILSNDVTIAACFKLCWMNLVWSLIGIMAAYCLWNKEKFHLSSEIWIMCSCGNWQYLATDNILSLERKIHNHSPPCSIHYIVFVSRGYYRFKQFFLSFLGKWNTRFVIETCATNLRLRDSFKNRDSFTVFSIKRRRNLRLAEAVRL